MQCFMVQACRGPCALRCTCASKTIFWRCPEKLHLERVLWCIMLQRVHHYCVQVHLIGNLCIIFQGHPREKKEKAVCFRMRKHHSRRCSAFPGNCVSLPWLTLICRQRVPCLLTQPAEGCTVLESQVPLLVCIFFHFLPLEEH